MLQYLFIGPISALAACCIILVFRWYSHLGKQLVEIIDTLGIKSKGYFKLEDDRVIIKEAKRGKGGHPGYKPKYKRSCFLFYKEGWLFGSLKKKLMLKEGAESCIDFGTSQPSMGRGDIKDVFWANVFNKAGNFKTTLEIPVTLYLVIGACFVVSLLTLIQLLRFG